MDREGGGEGGEKERGGVGNERKRIKAKEKEISVQMPFSLSYGFSNKKGYNFKEVFIGAAGAESSRSEWKNWNKKVDTIITDHSLELDF